jgi:hypothetical protein
VVAILSRYSYALLGSLILWSTLSAAESRTVVAVLDTGVSTSAIDTKFLCNLEHVSFTALPWNVDKIKHGTVITKIITEGLDPEQMCVWIVKWFSIDESASSPRSLKLLESAAIYIHDRINKYNIKFINMSLSGQQPSLVERTMIKKALESGVIVMVPSGNDKLNIDLCKYNSQKQIYENCSFPANYASDSIPVGNLKHKNFHIVGCNPDPLYPCIVSNVGAVITDRASGTYTDVDAAGKIQYYFGTSNSAAYITNFLLKKYFTEK